jgi:glycine betaine/proline transport system substrate-binding protein
MESRDNRKHRKRLWSTSDAATRLLKILSVALVLCLLAVLAAGCSQKPVIRLYDGQWGSLWINNAIAEFIIEKGYGYPVEALVANTFVMQEVMEKGEIDLNLEMWQQNIIVWYNEQIEKGNIVNIGMTYEDSSQFFIIPKWVAEEYSIKTVFDMKEHWELFRDPEDPSKGIVYNGIIGWEATEINKVKLEAYGLTRYYNLVTAGSKDGLEAALARAHQSHKPVFGYYWAPAPLIGAYDWYVLEEPPFTDECWEKVLAAIEDEGLRPLDQACAYESLPIDKVAHKGLLKKAPDVVEMLERMNVGLEPLNDILGWADKNEVQDWEKAAIYYLQNYEDRWKTWVTPEAYERIKKALEEASS